MRALPKLSKHHVDPRAYPPGVAYMDGQYLAMRDAKLSVLDYGFLHSDATYDVVHVWNGAFFRLQDHLDRFFRGMRALHMAVPYDQSQVAEILHNCVALSGLRKAYVEVICTRGTAPNFSRDPRDAENRLIAFAIPFGSVASETQLAQGLHVSVTDVLRIPPPSVDPTVKNYHWLDMVRALYAAYDTGADTALLRDGHGNVAEGPGFNVFAVREGAVSTPEAGVLLGVTRQTVFDICSSMRVACSSGPLSLADLRTADEVFVTSTAGGVMPVTRIDGRPVGAGRVGPLTTEIKDRYWQLHDDPSHRTAIAYPE